MIANSGALRFHIGRMIRTCTSTPTPATRMMLTNAETASGQPSWISMACVNMPPSMTKTPCAKLTMPLAL
jgi:hypothetical protein